MRQDDQTTDGTQLARLGEEVLMSAFDPKRILIINPWLLRRYSITSSARANCSRTQISGAETCFGAHESSTLPNREFHCLCAWYGTDTNFLKR